MKKLVLLLLLVSGCVSYPEVRSPRYFNTEVEILDYHANPVTTTWTLKAKPGETMRLVFNYEIIDIDFKPDKEGEFIFTVTSQVHGQ